MLSITHLSKTYANGTRALHDVSLDIDNGIFGLLGPNGAGKSSLMRTIATLQEADSGSIAFHGHDVIGDPQFLRKQLGYLPQDFGVYPRIPAVELLDYLAMLKGIGTRAEREKQVHALLQLTNLHDVRHRAVSTYSGGMKQRFGIAQALLGDPRLIIVDEPTAGLDPEERNRFHDLLSEIGENVVVILSTHIVDDVSELCSRLAVLDGGSVRAFGRPAELIAQLEGKVWRKTIPKTDLEDHRNRLQVLSTRLFGGELRIHVKAAQRPDEGFQQVAPDLEDVYFSVLREC